MNNRVKMPSEMEIICLCIYYGNSRTLVLEWAVGLLSKVLGEWLTGWLDGYPLDCYDFYSILEHLRCQKGLCVDIVVKNIKIAHTESSREDIAQKR